MNMLHYLLYSSIQLLQITGHNNANEIIPAAIFMSSLFIVAGIIIIFYSAEHFIVLNENNAHPYV